MEIILIFLLILFCYSLLWLSMAKWKTLMVGSLKENGKEIYKTYHQLKKENVRCKLVEKEIDVENEMLWLLIRKDEYEEAKLRLKNSHF